ncbi:4-hydroxyphenylpyruvate dioxygenase [Reticulomyxa filosa]|uniref:4-hydroxyphenylpyruvate dioxygenase n=1 Tax=Reticulomyxa filosa TaxID=46433 RepID=X6NAT4_RETFI|nr:4-hydroxyphenylpyruvate dioxygenase [Reticulomyxa filosa]|eukprot:ETO23380.1 4-hydroxyphenylpyruvate dioxygenase [Reticulomyxa filosa]
MLIAKHGDSVRDVAFEVDDVKVIWKNAVENGAFNVLSPTVFEDEYGQVIMASLKTYGDCVHTLVQRINYSGPFLPGYVSIPSEENAVFVKFYANGLLSVSLEKLSCKIQTSELPKVGLSMIDHVVGNQDEGEMDKAAEWYSKVLNFHRFWSVDDKQVHTEYSSLRSVVMTDFDQTIKMPLNEPAKGKRKSQIKEYIEFHGGAGVQHIALRTNDIEHTKEKKKETKYIDLFQQARGLKLLAVPENYYDDLKQRLKGSSVEVMEDLKILEELSILVDFDDKGYLLQIFTDSVEDRPTLFYEIIQRHNNDGFGAGNFKALFTSIEKEQMKRGTSTPQSEL